MSTPLVLVLHSTGEPLVAAPEAPETVETNMQQIEEDPGEFVPYAEPEQVETLVVMMTETEARSHVKKINDLVGSVGKLLLDLKEREGWKALGYHTWTECLNQEFDESRSYLYRLMAGEEVRRDLSPIGDIESSQIPESQLRQLVDVPSEQRGEVYKEAKATAPDGKVTAKHIRSVKERRVNKKRRPAPNPKVVTEVFGDTMEARYDRFWYNLCRDLLYYPTASDKDGLFAYMIDLCTKARQVLHETNDGAGIYQRTSLYHLKILGGARAAASAPESETLSPMT